MHQDVVGFGCGFGHGFEPEHLRPPVASVDHRLHRLFFLFWNPSATALPYRTYAVGLGEV